MRKTIFAMAIAMLSFIGAISAQNYQSAIGARLGSPLAVSYKMFLSEPAAIEFFGGLGYYAGDAYLNANAAYEHHIPFSNTDGLSWYFGGGGGVSLWSGALRPASAPGASINLLGVLGLDYTFRDIPLNLSIDWMPTFILGDYRGGFRYGYGALAARYVLK